MSKIYINNSGESYATINGELVHDVGYIAESDGNRINFSLKDNDEVLNILNIPAKETQLIDRMLEMFPLAADYKKLQSKKKKSNSKNKKSNSKKKKKRRTNRKSKYHIDRITD
tara:strand:- start:95 stop:433 length:339 start_codon:yes stop_codon:yes gene_type:complete